MSGSSLDGVDIALCRFDVEKATDGTVRLNFWELLRAETLPFSEDWKERLVRLPAGSAINLVHAHADLGHFLGKLVKDFVKNLPEIFPTIDLVASHGHTIFHEPALGFTCQIGDGAALAVEAGCTVVCDFRSSDVALGGQGAPLAPLADKVLFPGYDFYLNLGGISNLTCYAEGKYVAFDVGGANQMLNALSRQIGLSFDRGGQVAAGGVLDKSLFDRLNSLPYFSEPYPKSLSNQWVQENCVRLCLDASGKVEDKLRTTTEHIAFQIANSIAELLEKERIEKKRFSLFATGGGALNGFLMSCIREYARPFGELELVLPAKEIIEFKEAIFMALLGVLRLEGAPNCLSSVTGASRDAVGGAIFSP